MGLGEGLSSKQRGWLENLKEIAGSLWQTDKLISGYPSHGSDHTERVEMYARDILGARQLPAEQEFAVLAAIHLHDIGMQCDPRSAVGGSIRSQALKRGVVFREAFAASSGPLSISEQTEIRNNHGHMSAEWLLHDKKHKTGTFSAALDPISPLLVEDIAEICRYHTKKPILECPEKMKSANQQESLRFAAALVRFADELDISAARVSLRTIKAFRLDSADAVYWFLHSKTECVFRDGSLKLQVQLSEDDFDRYSQAIELHFVRKFLEKNRDVIDILTSNGIEIRSDTSRPVEKAIAGDDLPSDIAEMITTMWSPLASAGSPGLAHRPEGVRVDSEQPPNIAPLAPTAKQAPSEEAPGGVLGASISLAEELLRNTEALWETQQLAQICQAIGASTLRLNNLLQRIPEVEDGAEHLSETLSRDYNNYITKVKSDLKHLTQFVQRLERHYAAEEDWRVGSAESDEWIWRRMVAIFACKQHAPDMEQIEHDCACMRLLAELPRTLRDFVRFAGRIEFTDAVSTVVQWSGPMTQRLKDLARIQAKATMHAVTSTCPLRRKGDLVRHFSGLEDPATTLGTIIANLPHYAATSGGVRIWRAEDVLQ